jgi:hypothetical protein
VLAQDHTPEPQNRLSPKQRENKADLANVAQQVLINSSILSWAYRFRRGR